ncbi:patatin-like phospholipase family protein [Flavobacteriaceae bacterium KMM 6898]|nr:patatin-like phospholipase family protein [Flavobacteriaceae bacterium KMM 6898]
MNTGLVLSGGGIRGIAHIGAIKALQEIGIQPTHIAGTSAGAIVGALYAEGHSCEEILKFFKTVELFSFNTYALGKPGFVDSDKLFEIFKKFIPHDTFEGLKMRLFLTGTNILDGTAKIFNEGPLIKAILASAAYPGVFTPVNVNGEYYVDGGILNNFPVEAIQDYCDTIIGVYVNPFETMKLSDLKHSYNVIDRALHIKMKDGLLSKFKACDLLISPNNLSGYGTFSFKSADIIYELGYKAAMEAMQSKKGLLILNKV